MDLESFGTVTSRIAINGTTMSKIQFILAPLMSSNRTKFSRYYEIFNGLSRNYCGNCSILVTWSPWKRTKIVLDGGWP